MDNNHSFISATRNQIGVIILKIFPSKVNSILDIFEILSIPPFTLFDILLIIIENATFLILSLSRLAYTTRYVHPLSNSAKKPLEGLIGL